MTFGQRLKLLREEMGITQVDLSKIMNISNSTLSLYESDSRNPDFDTLKKIARFFGVSTDYLLGLTEMRSSDAAGSQDIYSFDFKDLPDEAIKRIEEYVDFIRERFTHYGSDKK